MRERREQSLPSNIEGCLWRLPARELLKRLPTAIMGVDSLGDIAYANPACAEMLGYPDGGSVMRLHLPALLTGHGGLAATDCIDTLRRAAPVVEWNHAQGYVIRTMLSRPLLKRHTDSMLVIGVMDVTAWLWETKSR